MPSVSDLRQPNRRISIFTKAEDRPHPLVVEETAQRQMDALRESSHRFGVELDGLFFGKISRRRTTVSELRLPADVFGSPVLYLPSWKSGENRGDLEDLATHLAMICLPVKRPSWINFILRPLSRKSPARSASRILEQIEGPYLLRSPGGKVREATRAQLARYGSIAIHLPTSIIASYAGDPFSDPFGLSRLAAEGAIGHAHTHPGGMDQFTETDFRLLHHLRWRWDAKWIVGAVISDSSVSVRAMKFAQQGVREVRVDENSPWMPEVAPA